MKFCPVVPEICRGHVHVPKKERRIIIIIIRYDYNLTIMKSPKLANDCFRRHHVEELQTCRSNILRVSKGAGVTIESYGKLDISYINVGNF
jgi:hypothetical protein